MADMDSLNLPTAETIAVGVSGGADSLCLALLLKKWADKKKCRVVAITVDHNLRPNSKAEAHEVGRILAAHNIEHHILTWTGKKPTTRIEEKAREARYALLQEFCGTHGITSLYLAHHGEDQAETFLARLARGSGIDGLSAMKPVSVRGKLTLLRPLLEHSKQDISDTLISLNQKWIEDPMNQDTAFERVRWRQSLPALWKMGLSCIGIRTATKRLERARGALEFYTERFIQSEVYVDNRGFARVNTAAFWELPTDIQIRVLGRLLTLIGQSDKPLSLDALEKTILRLPCQTTLGECHIISHKTGLFIAKESARQPSSQKIPPCQWTHWDRFWIWSEQAAVIKASAPLKREKNIPFLVQCSFPQIKPQKRLEKIPHLDYKRKITYMISYIHFTPKNKG